jgi:hypothetical protein
MQAPGSTVTRFWTSCGRFQASRGLDVAILQRQEDDIA